MSRTASHDIGDVVTTTQKPVATTFAVVLTLFRGQFFQSSSFQLHCHLIATVILTQLPPPSP